MEAVGELSDDAEDGYIFEVDLTYSQDLHDARDDYPLAPESSEIGRDMYSPAQQAALPQTAPQRKLTPNLRDKVRYVLPYCNLKLYLQLRLVVTRIHRVFTFKLSTWLKTYIDWKQFPKGLLQINEHPCFWKDTREFEEMCTGRTDYRCWYLTQTGCQTEFLYRQPHYRLPDCYTVHCGNSYTESTNLRGLFRARLVKAAHVQLSLQAQLRLLLTDTDSLAYLFIIYYLLGK